MKLVLNLVAVANSVTLAEGLAALGETIRMPAKKAGEVLMTGMAASKMYELEGPKIAARSHEPRFEFSHMAKGLRYPWAWAAMRERCSRSPDSPPRSTPASASTARKT